MEWCEQQANEKRDRDRMSRKEKEKLEKLYARYQKLKNKLSTDEEQRRKVERLKKSGKFREVVNGKVVLTEKDKEQMAKEALRRRTKHTR